MKRKPHTTTLRERRKNMAETLTFGRTATELQKREKKFTRSQKRVAIKTRKQFPTPNK